MNITNLRLTLSPEDNPRCLATVTATVDNAIALEGIRIGRRVSDGSLYVLMPAIRRRDGTFREPFHPISTQAREDFVRPILDHYDRVLEDETLSGRLVSFSTQNNGPSLNITDVSIFPLNRPDSRVKAIATVTLDNAFVIKSIRVIEQPDGTLGLGMCSWPKPSEDPEGKPTWVQHYHPVSAPARAQLLSAISQAYHVQ